MTCIPEGQKESQLILWLKDLVYRSDNQISRRAFIRNMKAAHPNVRWNSGLFFGILYSLTQPDLYPLACEWLRGDELDADSLKQLQTETLINTEENAQNLIKNLGVIAASTKPIIICFDQVGASGSRNTDGTVDLQPLLSLNTMLHNQKSSNFLIIISVVTDVWRQQRLEEPDLARIDDQIVLNKINLEQARAIWESRLYPLHQQASDQPASSISPLTDEDLQRNFPTGKATPRNVIKVGERLIRGGNVDTVAAFKMAWLDQYKSLHQQVKTIRQYSSEQLINLLKIALECLQIEEIQNDVFPSKTKFNSHAISYLFPQSEKIKIIWNEESNLNTFAALMKKVQKLNQKSDFKKLYLIRQQNIGDSRNKGYKILEEICKYNSNEHLIPSLESVLYLVTYREFYNAAIIQELTIGDEIPNVSRLQELTRQAEVFKKCDLLQQLMNFSPPPPPLDEIKEFLFNMVQIQFFIGRQVLIDKTIAEFSDQTSLTEVNHAIEQLTQEKKVKIINPSEPVEAQSICLLPNT